MPKITPGGELLLISCGAPDSDRVEVPDEPPSGRALMPAASDAMVRIRGLGRATPRPGSCACRIGSVGPLPGVLRVWDAD